MRNTPRAFLIAALALHVTLASVTQASEPEELSCGSKFETADAVKKCLTEAVAHTERDIEAMQQALLTALEFARGQLQNTAGVVVQRADEVFAKSQHAWLAFRNANCAYFDQVYAAVSTPGLEQVVCLLRMTRQRRHELNDERQFWVYKFRVPDLPPVEEAK